MSNEIHDILPTCEFVSLTLFEAKLKYNLKHRAGGSVRLVFLCGCVGPAQHFTVCFK